MKTLTDHTVDAKLRRLRGWKRSGNEIVRTVVRKDFVQAMGFVQSVAILAEKMDHHPDITIRWNTVTIVLSTHSAGGITDKDITLASLINTIR